MVPRVWMFPSPVTSSQARWASFSLTELLRASCLARQAGQTRTEVIPSSYFSSKSSANCPLLSWTSVVNCFSMVITWFLSGLASKVITTVSVWRLGRWTLTHRWRSCSVCWRSGESALSAPVSWSAAITIQSLEKYTNIHTAPFLRLPGTFSPPVWNIHHRCRRGSGGTFGWGWSQSLLVAPPQPGRRRPCRSPRTPWRRPWRPARYLAVSVKKKIDFQ